MHTITTMWYLPASQMRKPFSEHHPIYNFGNGSVMKQYRNSATLILLAVMFHLLMAVAVHADTERIYGKAVNTEGKLIFFEEHIVQYENDRISALNTIYYDADGNKIGELVSDFSHEPHFGSYDFKDERLRYHDGVKVIADQVLIYCRESPEAATKEKYLQRESNQIVGQGLHQFLLTHFDALMQGEAITAKLVLPAQMDQFDIRISKGGLEDDRLRIRIDLDNWFLRLFVPHVEAEYDLATRRLISYKGVSMIADESGKTVPITISYSYDQQNPLVSSRF